MFADGVEDTCSCPRWVSGLEFDYRNKSSFDHRKAGTGRKPVFKPFIREILGCIYLRLLDWQTFPSSKWVTLPTGKWALKPGGLIS